MHDADNLPPAWLVDIRGLLCKDGVAVGTHQNALPREAFTEFLAADLFLGLRPAEHSPAPWQVLPPHVFCIAVVVPWRR